MTLCTATTQAGGIASCPDSAEVDAGEFSAEPTSYTATFAGNGPLHGSTATQTVTSAN